MEVESGPANGNEYSTKTLQPVDTKRSKRRKCCFCCLGGTLVCLIVLAVVVTILALTVFKVKKPKMKIDNLVLQDLDMSLNPLNFKLNITLGSNITVHNPNKIGMKYKESRTIIYYRGKEVGQSPIPAGKLDANSDGIIVTNITVMADRMLSSNNLISDAFSGSLPLNTITKLKGKVIILSIFKFHVNTKSSCNILLKLSTRHVDRNCSYSTSL